MLGREGQVRLLLPVRSQAHLATLCDELSELGVESSSIQRLGELAPLVTGAGVFRIGVEYLADQGRLGQRLGAEVLINPATFDVVPVLAKFGVPDDALARFQAIAATVPSARVRPRGIAWLPKMRLAPMVDALAFMHFSAAWAPGATPRVKSYLMVTSHVARDVDREAAAGPFVQRAGEVWPHRLAWAGNQLPLAPGFSEAAGSDVAPLTPTPTDWQEWQQALGVAAVSADRGGLLGQRLHAAGLSTAQAEVALSQAAPTVQPAPDWLPWFTQIRDAVTDYVRSAHAEPLSDWAALEWLAAREAEMPEAALAIPFAALWWPGVQMVTAAALGTAHGTHEADESVTPGSQSHVRLSEHAVRGLQVALLTRLSMVSAPTLLHVMTDGLTYGQRLLRQVLDSSEDPPRVAFARFCAGLASGELNRVFLDYPVMPSLIGTTGRQWHEATREMLTRIDRHRQELHAEFGIDDAAELTAVMVSAGDQHNDGRSVAVLRFGERRVVYKPRDMALEHLWADLAELVGRDGAPVRAARVLASADVSPYGFAEFIDHEPAADDHELQQFYRNAGRTLALLHALSATDCHYENLIANRDQLVLVDAEALFETRSTRMHAMEPSENRSLGTVMDVGMLPAWMWLEGEQQAIDITALGASSETMRGRASRSWKAPNTDAMHRGPVQVTPGQPTSLPTDGENVPDLRDYTELLVAGFERGYRELIGARDQLSSRLQNTREVRRRLIQRATYIYAVLLYRSVEPEALRSRNSRGMVLERLARAYLGGPDEAWALLGAEQEALARLDVPIFETDLRGTATSWLGGDLAQWPGDDALAGVLDRLAALNEDDMRWQSKLIRSAVAARYFTGNEGGTDAPTVAAAAGVDAATGDGSPALPVVDGASPLADRIVARVAGDALRTDGAVTWMTLALLNDGEHANVQRIGTGLYDGILGVATYLFEVGAGELAEAALKPLLEELESGDAARVQRQLLTVGVGWSGAGGYLRTLRWLESRGHLDPQRADDAVAFVLSALSPAVMEKDNWLDVMNGAAGLIVPLAAEPAAADMLEPLLAAAADHLLDHQHDDGGWVTLPGRAPLTGYAHGAAGIALALVVAYQILGEEKYLDAALRGLAYEAAAFDVAAGNWPDFRSTARSGFMLGWCAGAPGIALTRSRLLQLLPEHPAVAQWERELEAGARTTATIGLLERDHVCCGNLGRVAVLEALGTEHGRDDWLTAAARLREQVVARAGGGLPRPFLGGAPNGAAASADSGASVLAVPGLMTGLAGQGWLLNTPDPSTTHAWVGALLL